MGASGRAVPTESEYDRTCQQQQEPSHRHPPLVGEGLEDDGSAWTAASGAGDNWTKVQ